MVDKAAGPGERLAVRQEAISRPRCIPIYEEVGRVRPGSRAATSARSRASCRKDMVKVFSTLFVFTMSI
jgi:hypothetical protein